MTAFIIFAVVSFGISIWTIAKRHETIVPIFMSGIGNFFLILIYFCMTKKDMHITPMNQEVGDLLIYFPFGLLLFIQFCIGWTRIFREELSTAK